MNRAGIITGTWPAPMANFSTVEHQAVRRHIGAMSEHSQAFSAGVAPPGDFVLPFDIAKAGVRGRFVRLDTASAQALDAHQLPEAAARVAGESLALGGAAGFGAEAGRAADGADQEQRAARSRHGRLLRRRRGGRAARRARLCPAGCGAVCRADRYRISPSWRARARWPSPSSPSAAARPIRASCRCRPTGWRPRRKPISPSRSNCPP